MSRIQTYEWISDRHQIGIGHNYRSGVDAPFDEPLSDSLALTYSRDSRTQRNYTLFSIQPYESNAVKLVESQFNEEIQANMLTYFNIGDLNINFYPACNSPLLWRKSEWEGLVTFQQEGNAFNPNWNEGGNPPWTGYSWFNPVTDFKQKYLAVYPYVVAQYLNSNGRFDETTDDSSVGLYEYFTQGVTPTIPSGATFKGIAIRYNIVTSYGTDGRTNKLLFMGKVCNLKLGTVAFRTDGETRDCPIPDSYCFPCTDNTLLGSTRTWARPGGWHIFTRGFVGDRRFLYVETPDVFVDNVRDHTVISTQGISYEDALASALAKGFPVLDSSDTARNFQANTYDNFMAYHLDDHYVSPVIEDTGEVTNDFLRGAAVFDQDNPKSKKTPNQKFGDEDTNPYDVIPEFDRDDPDSVDPNDYADETPLNEVPSFMNPIGKFNRYFAITSEEVNDLAEFLSPSSDNVFDDILNGLKLYGENPMNFMLELMAFPFDITEYTGKQQQEIVFGRRISTGINGDIITDASIVIDLGTCYFKRFHKNFLDYEPYTTAKMYIPYCNELSIPTSVFLGHYINVKLIIDLSTGGCTGVVSKVQDMNGTKPISVLYTQGQIGVPIPMTGVDNSKWVDAAMNFCMSTIDNGIQIGTNAGLMGTTSMTESTGSSTNKITGGSRTFNDSKAFGETKQHKVSAGGIAGGVLNELGAIYDFATTPTPLITTGTGISYANFFKPQQCYFIVQSAVPMNVSGYANSVGHACMEYRKLQNGDGFIVAHNPNVQPANATSQETSEINALLATGVWY